MTKCALFHMQTTKSVHLNSLISHALYSAKIVWYLYSVHPNMFKTKLISSFCVIFHFFPGCMFSIDGSNLFIFHRLFTHLNHVFHVSRLMGKPTICIGENKDADQLRAFVFATRIVRFLFYLNRKFQASSSFLCLYRPVCVGTVRKPHCWFSHEVAHIKESFQFLSI